MIEFEIVIKYYMFYRFFLLENGNNIKDILYDRWDIYIFEELFYF